MKAQRLSKKPGIEWQSRWLSPTRVTTISKASELLKAVLYDVNRRREVRQFLGTLGGFGHAECWAAIDGILAQLPAGILRDLCIRRGKDGQAAFLREKFLAVKSGTTLEITEPTKETLTEQNTWTRNLTQLVIDMMLQGVQITEFELAVLVYYEWSLRDADLFSILSERELSDVALQSGFQIVARNQTLFGLRTHFTLRKPTPPITR